MNSPTVTLELDIDDVITLTEGSIHLGSWLTVYVVDDGPGGSGDVIAIVRTKGDTRIEVTE